MIFIHSITINNEQGILHCDRIQLNAPAHK